VKAKFRNKDTSAPIFCFKLTFMVYWTTFMLSLIVYSNVIGKRAEESGRGLIKPSVQALSAETSIIHENWLNSHWNSTTARRSSEIIWIFLHKINTQGNTSQHASITSNKTQISLSNYLVYKCSENFGAATKSLARPMLVQLEPISRRTGRDSKP